MILLSFCACQPPPETTLTDGALAADVAATPADAASDARIVDGAVDATPSDAGPPDAPPPDLDANPHGILLVDVTLESLGGFLPGGASLSDPWAVGSGAAIGDVDGDGDLDLAIARNDDPASPRRGGPSSVFLNDGTGAFTPDPLLAAALATVRGHGAALGDIDRDGDLDLFIAAEGPDWLFENDGAGHFVDVTAAAGVAGPGEDLTSGALFADLNHDGQLDLYVMNYTLALPPWADDRARNRLHLNVGDGRFLDVSAASGADDDGAAQAALVFDLDGAGDPTLYVVNDAFCGDGVPLFGMPEDIPDDAWLRLDSIDDQGVPHFVDVADARGTAACRSSMGMAIADVDGDLTPDLYLTDIGANELYFNTAPGAPLSLAPPTDLEQRLDFDGHRYTSWGARFVDLDRDGALEAFVVHGSVQEPLTCGDYHQLDSFLRAPTAGGPLYEITPHVGLPSTLMCFWPDGALPMAGRAVVTGDLDGDGDDDFVITPWVETFRLFENATPPGLHELRVRLRGTVSAPDPVGATLTVTRADASQAATFRAAGGEPYSQSDALLRLGVGADTSIIRAEVRWPSGLVQRIDALPGFALDTEVVIAEPAWFAVEPRVAAAADPAPVLLFTAPDGGLHAVSASRSDGVPVVVTSLGGGVYTAALPHPGVARRTVVTLTVDGEAVRARPMIDFRM